MSAKHVFLAINVIHFLKGIIKCSRHFYRFNFPFFDDQGTDSSSNQSTLLAIRYYFTKLLLFCGATSQIKAILFSILSELYFDRGFIVLNCGRLMRMMQYYYQSNFISRDAIQNFRYGCIPVVKSFNRNINSRLLHPCTYSAFKCALVLPTKPTIVNRQSIGEIQLSFNESL